MRRFVYVLLALLAAQFMAVTPASASPPLRYHLALGDSLPYGFTTAKALAGLPPSAFTGFTDIVAGLTGTRKTTVNYSCPGESTASFIAGPCGWRAAGFRLHDDYSGSQLAAAEAFLERQPRGRAGLITLTLWGNDIRQFIASCPDVQCIIDRAPAEIAAFAGRLQWTVTRLRAAAPHARIVVVGAYLVPDENAALGEQLIGALNDASRQVAQASKAGFANPAPVFKPAICELTLVCAESDGHPSPAGHLALAALIMRSLKNV